MPKKLRPIRTVKDPTTEMVRFYYERTLNHIKQVKANLRKISDWVEIPLSLVNERCENHDQSKFTDAEFVPYTHLTWQKKQEAVGKSHNCTPIQNKIKKAIANHYDKNSHHPEHFTDISDMKFIDLAEMVADWAAVSMETGKSLMGWYVTNCTSKKKRWNFNQIQLNQIKFMVGLFKELK